ncbi:MAG: hypothetical protein XD73_0775 [Anaerolinea thermophila]|uniref:Uncharacterized protein n=1 Tax=Anaerolinea thermophila TaxID=167964 RepID=A0A101FXP4_9CHLR|nr:MAG: hypothetical protein XD73_0775 [Anaerolinea thermophila]
MPLPVDIFEKKFYFIPYPVHILCIFMEKTVQENSYFRIS